MRRTVLVLVFLVLFLVAGVVSRVIPVSAGPAAAPPAAARPLCAFVCDKTGINTGAPIGAPPAEYLHAQRLGMGWVLEVAGSMSDVNKTAGAINEANAHGLRAIVRICAGDTCELYGPDGDPSQGYSDFLHAVAEKVDGEFWALMGPNEPDLEHWAGGGPQLASYMNALIDKVADIPNLKKLSPAYNLTNKATPGLFSSMESAGARFGDLDGLAGTSYNLGGTPAYYYYAHTAGESFRNKALRFHKPFVIIETGTFAMTGLNGLGNPKRAPVVAALRKDFGMLVGDPTVMGVLYFNAFGDDQSRLYHVLYDPELVTISQDAYCSGGGYAPVGVGVTTSQQLWQPSGAQVCKSAQYGCPFIGAASCQPGVCVDNDGDGLPGDGNGCTRTDCNDSNASVGGSCDGGEPAQQAAWGTLRVVDSNVPAPQAWSVVKIGANGLPVIGYRSGSQYQGGLTFLQCTAANCTTALRRVLVPDNNSGSAISMQVRTNTNNRPILAYVNSINNYLETFDCADPGCVTGSVNVEDQSVQPPGLETSLTLLPGDVPSIAYWATNGNDLGVVTCTNGDCSLTNVAPKTPDQTGSTGLHPNVFTGQNGFPNVIYSNTGPKIRLLVCDDAACTSSTYNRIISNAQSLATSGVVIRQNGWPLVLYRRLPTSGGEVLALYDCGNATCSTGTSTDLYTPAGQIVDGSIALAGDGRLFIAFSEQNAGVYSLGVIACPDTTCAGAQTDRLTDGNVGEHPDVVFRPDGNPLVVYHDVGNGRLMVYDVNTQLIATPQATSVPTATPTATDTPAPTQPGTPMPPATSTPVVPAAPVLVSPGNSAFFRSTPAFSWSAVAGARWYQFEYTDLFDASGPIFNPGDGHTVTSGDIPVPRIVPAPMAKGAYFWHVRARTATGPWGDWGVFRVLTIALPLPHAPALVSPPNRAKIPTGIASLTWKKLPDDVTSYEVQLDISSLFSAPLFATTLTGPFTTTTINVNTTLLASGSYIWRVRGLNADGEPGPWSRVANLTVP